MGASKVTLKMAIRACCLQDSVTPQLLHYYVKKQELKELEQGLNKKEGMIIDVSTTSCDANHDKEDGTITTNKSPLTEPSELLSSESVVASDEQQDEEGDRNEHEGRQGKPLLQWSIFNGETKKPREEKEREKIRIPQI